MELGGAEDLLGDGLDEGPQRESIARRDHVDGHAHERRAHGAALLEGRRELGGVEVPKPRPQRDVGRQRRLRLQADEVLERALDAARRASQQELAFEQGAVERARAEPRHACQRAVTSCHVGGGAGSSLGSGVRRPSRAMAR
jgi:hypothetical protein